VTENSLKKQISEEVMITCTSTNFRFIHVLHKYMYMICKTHLTESCDDICCSVLQCVAVFGAVFAVNCSVWQRGENCTNTCV